MLLPSLPQEPQPPPALEEVVVTAPRSHLPVTSSTANVTVVTAEELAASGERSLPRQIGRAAGVWIQESSLGGGAPVLRGLLGNQILILVDGVRLNDATTRFGPNQSLNTIDPGIVERVEIIRGTRSVLWGSDAIGGVIAIWTKRRHAGSQGGGAGLETGYQLWYDSATDGWRGNLDLSGANEVIGARGILGAGDWHDLRAGDGEEQAHTGYRASAAFGSLDFALGEEKSLRVMTMVHSDFDVPRTFDLVPGFGQTEPAYQLYDFALQEREMAVVTYDDFDLGGAADRMQVRLSARRYTEQRERQRTGSDTLVFGQTQVDTAGLGADWAKALGESHLLTYGLDLYNDDVDSYNDETDTTTGTTTREPGDFAPNASYLSLGTFVQDEISSLAPTYFTLGLRWSYFDFGFDDSSGASESGDFDALTASFEVAHDLSDDLRVSGTLAQGFQAPNLEDLANDGDFAGGVELANPDLEAATSLMAEIAVEVQRPVWSANAAAFWTGIDDYIGRRLLDAGDPSVAGDEVYMRDNAGEVELYGLEVAGECSLGAQGSEWSLESRMAWVRGRQYDDTVDPTTGEAPLDGVEARRVPPFFGRVGVRWEEGDGPDLFDQASIWLAGAAAQDRLHPDDVSDPRIDPDGTPGWTTWTLDLGGALSDGVRWSVLLVNLLDENYRVHSSAIDGPGRSIVIGLTAAF